MKRDLKLEATIRTKYQALERVLSERALRLWAATESISIGYGGDSVVAGATGLARETIRAGREEFMSRNEAWVSVGRDHDTPAFAVASIGQWWKTMGRPAYPRATELLITADAGGSNGYRTRAWKSELQRFADETGLCIHVCHFPPGTSKWNKTEHRLFCHITQNWRGKPLTSFETVVNLIGSTRTTKGLRVPGPRQ